MIQIPEQVKDAPDRSEYKHLKCDFADCKS